MATATMPQDHWLDGSLAAIPPKSATQSVILCPARCDGRAGPVPTPPMLAFGFGDHSLLRCATDGATVFEHACRLGLEGIVSKRRDSTFQPGRSRMWLKVKNPASPAMQRVWEERF